MSEQIRDQQFESLVRAALKAEAARLPVLVRPDDVLERRRVRAPRGRVTRLAWMPRTTAAGRDHRWVRIAAVAAAATLAGTVGLAIIAGQPSVEPTPSPAAATEAPSSPSQPSVFGIFEPIAGFLAYGNNAGIWGVDPAAPPGATGIKLAVGTGTPIGWSADGTRLLLERDFEIFVLDADGTETQINDPGFRTRGGSISPNGSRVVYATGGLLYAVETDGGVGVVIAAARRLRLEEPSFSPDGAKVAYVDGNGDNGHTVWVVDADGTNAHQIVEVPGSHIYGLAWSPAGDRIAISLDDEGTITFAPDGSAFTHVREAHPYTGNPIRPFWSPDGSELEWIGPWHPGAAAVPPSSVRSSP